MKTSSSMDIFDRLSIIFDRLKIKHVSCIAYLVRAQLNPN